MKLIRTVMFIVLLTPVMFLANSFAQDSPISIKADGTVNDIKYSPDGRLLAVATSKGLYLYDVMTLKKVETLMGHEGGVNALAFSPDGKLFVSVGADKTAQVYNVDNGKLRKRNAFSIGVVLAIEFVDSGKLRGATAEGDIPEWNANTGNVISLNNEIFVLKRIDTINRIIKTHSRTAAAFSVDGEWIARAGKFAEGGKGLAGIEDVYIRVFPADIRVAMRNTKKNILHFSMNPKDQEDPKYPITALAFASHKNNTVIAIGNESGKIAFLDIEDKKVLKPHLEHKEVNALAFSSTGPLASEGKHGPIPIWFASGSKDGTILIWEFDSVSIYGKALQR